MRRLQRWTVALGGAALLLLIARTTSACPMVARRWYHDPIEPDGGVGASKGWPDYGNVGDSSLQNHPEWTANLPGEQAYRDPSGQSAFAWGPGGEGGVWLTDGAATLLADPTNTHASWWEEFSVDVRITAAGSIAWYVGQVRTSGLTGTTDDFLGGLGVRVQEVAGEQEVSILADGGWEDTGVILGGEGFHRFFWDFFTPDHRSMIHVLDESGAPLFEQEYGNFGEPISAVNGLVLAAEDADWVFDNLTFGDYVYGYVDPDLDYDGDVDDDDLSLLLANWGDPYTDDDLSLLLANWTGNLAVPEPAALSLLSLWGMAVVRQRQRVAR